MKKLYFLLISILLSLGLNAQTFNSLPGMHNWTDSSAWDLGYPPDGNNGNIPTYDTINIMANSIINLDTVIYTYEGVVNNYGQIVSYQSTHYLYVNYTHEFNNYGRIEFDSTNSAQIIFYGGKWINKSSGYINVQEFYFSAGDTLRNEGEINVGEFGGVISLCNNGLINAAYIYNEATTWNNGIMNVDFYETPTYGKLINEGVLNAISLNVSSFLNTSQDTVYVEFGVYTDGRFKSYGPMYVGEWFANWGDTTSIDDFLYVGNSLDIGANNIFINNGEVIADSNLTNYGTLTGSNNGQYIIAEESKNYGTINGDIDVCDLTLLPGTYLDVDNGTVDFNTVTFCNQYITGIDDLMEGATKMVSPNPSQGVFTLANYQNTTVELVNSSGQLIFKDSIASNYYRLDLTTYPSGVYLLKSTSKTSFEVIKVVKD